MCGGGVPRFHLLRESATRSSRECQLVVCLCLPVHFWRAFPPRPSSPCRTGSMTRDPFAGDVGIFLKRPFRQVVFGVNTHASPEVCKTVVLVLKLASIVTQVNIRLFASTIYPRILVVTDSSHRLLFRDTLACHLRRLLLAKTQKPTQDIDTAHPPETNVALTFGKSRQGIYTYIPSLYNYSLP